MIISFSVENWMSFRDRTSFSAVASSERQHGERVPRVDKYKLKILPIAAIYGGNASGKTNFFQALYFIKHMVIQGTQPDSLIRINPFRLDDHSLEKPSSFALEFLVDEIVYEFSFTATKKAVIKEKLVEITSSDEKILYDRYDGEPHFHDTLKEEEFLQFAFKGTRENQLFLHNSVSQNIEYFKPIYDWFKNTLRLIAPDERFGLSFHEETHPLYTKINEVLSQLDTGIHSLGGKDISFKEAQIPERIKEKFEEEIKEDMTVMVQRFKGEQFQVTRKQGELLVKKLISYHLKADGTKVPFEISWESDGSQRVIDLLPAFLGLSANDAKRVYIFDELDRSLHTHLARQLLEAYLASCSKESRSQLLFTTHNALLIDQALFRRDELWVAERDPSGASTLFSFSDYKDLRYDKDIRKSYLQGRLGGIPRILLSGTFD